MASDGGEAPAQVQVGREVQVRLQVTYDDGSKGRPLGSSAAWSSDAEGVATVDAGTVRGVAPGTANVTGTSEGVSATLRVEVVAVAVQSVAADRASVSMRSWETATVGVTVSPADAPQGVTARSSSDAVATAAAG